MGAIGRDGRAPRDARASGETRDDDGDDAVDDDDDDDDARVLSRAGDARERVVERETRAS